MLIDSSELFIQPVASLVEDISSLQTGPIRIGVPGGRGAKSVVQGILSLEKDILSRVELYLIDERLSGETNRETLLSYGLQSAIEKGLFLTTQLIIPILGTPFIKNGFLDLLFVGVGEDGHIASLFPQSYKKSPSDDIILVTDSPKPPLERVSISYAALSRYASVSKVFLLFFGSAKEGSLVKFLHDEGSIEDLPVRYFLDTQYDVTLVTDIKVRG